MEHHKQSVLSQHVHKRRPVVVSSLKSGHQGRSKMVRNSRNILDALHFIVRCKY